MYDMERPLYGPLTTPGASPHRDHGPHRARDDTGRGGHHLAGPLSDLYSAVDARSESLSAYAGRSAVGDYARAAASACPPVLVRDAALRATDVHRARPPGRPVLRAGDRTAQREADLDWLSPRGCGGGHTHEAKTGSASIGKQNRSLLTVLRWVA